MYYTGIEVTAERFPTARGLCLYKVVNEELIACEPVGFVDGVMAVHSTLNQAGITGLVDVGGDLGDYFADILDDGGDILESVALDRKTYHILKTHWMRCKIDRTEELRQKGFLPSRSSYAAA